MVEKSKKLRVLMTTSSFPRYAGDGLEGGGEFLVRLYEGLADQVEALVIAPGSRGLPEEDTFGRFKVYRFKQAPFGLELAYGSGLLQNLMAKPWLLAFVPYFLVSQLLLIRRVVRRESVDVLHANWIIPQGLVAAIYQLFFGGRRRLPLVCSVHGSDLNSLNFFPVSWLLRWVLSRCSSLTVVSAPLGDVARSLGYRREPVHLPMGVDPDVFTPAARDPEFRRSVGNPEKIVLFVGQIVEAKGIRNLVEGFAKISARHPGAKLFIAGSGLARAEMEKKVEALGIKNSVTFMGAIDRSALPRIVASADVFVLPSYGEGFSVALLEAHASGVATLASDLPVHVALNRDYGFPLICRKGSSEDLAVKLDEMLSNPAKFAPIAKRGREVVVQNWSWEKLSAKFIGLLRSL